MSSGILPDDFAYPRHCHLSRFYSKAAAAGRLRGVPYGWVVVTDFILPHSLNGARYQDASTRVMHSIG